MNAVALVAPIVDADIDLQLAWLARAPHAMRSLKEGLTFREEVAKDPEIIARLSPEKLARAFDYKRQLANVDAIFERVLRTH